MLQLALSIPKSWYCCLTDLNLYDANGDLATQIGRGDYLGLPESWLDAPVALPNFLPVILWTDYYHAYLAAADRQYLKACDVMPPRLPPLDAGAIALLIPQVIAYARAAGEQPNQYLWGGRLPPNFDCSGLVQAAFAHTQIVVPRDAYQQEAFAQFIPYQSNFRDWIAELQAGDLVFFGQSKATHVGIYLGDGTYIHSSGSSYGHNCIAIDRLYDPNHLSSIPPSPAKHYAAELRGAGRICHSYQPDLTCGDRAN